MPKSSVPMAVTLFQVVAGPPCPPTVVVASAPKSKRRPSALDWKEEIMAPDKRRAENNLFIIDTSMALNYKRAS